MVEGKFAKFSFVNRFKINDFKVIKLKFNECQNNFLMFRKEEEEKFRKSN